MDKETAETPLEDILDHDADPEALSDPDIVEPVEEPKAEEPPQEEPAPEEPEQTMVPLAALHKERDAIRDLRAELDALKAPKQEAEKPAEIPDPVMDPEGFAAYTGKQSQSLAQQMQGQLYEQKLGMSRFQYAQEHSEQAAEELVQWFGTQSAHVQQEAMQHPHPFAFAHKLKEDAALSQQLSDPETRKAFEAFMANRNNPAPPPKAPVTTANARNVGDRTGPQWAGPTPLEEILKN